MQKSTAELMGLLFALAATSSWGIEVERGIDDPKQREQKANEDAKDRARAALARLPYDYRNTLTFAPGTVIAVLAPDSHKRDSFQPLSGEKPLPGGVYIVPYISGEDFVVRLARWPLKSELEDYKHEISGPAPWKDVEASEMVTMARQEKLGALIDRVDDLALAGGIPSFKVPPKVAVRRVAYSSSTKRFAFQPGDYSLSATDTYRSALEWRLVVRSSDYLVLDGEAVPEPFLGDLVMLPTPYAYGARESPNRTAEALARAFRRGNAEFPRQGYEIQNALPWRTGPALPPMLSRMNLQWADAFAWRAVASALEARKKSGDSMAGSVTATRDSLVDSLAHGNKNMLVLFAHNAESKIYFPDGGTLSFADIAAIKRDSPPERTIVLVTCSGGGNEGKTLTLGETLMANNLATTVFAARGAVKASDVPEIVDALRVGPVRKSLQEFRLEQLVEDGHATTYVGAR